MKATRVVSFRVSDKTLASLVKGVEKLGWKPRSLGELVKQTLESVVEKMVQNGETEEFNLNEAFEFVEKRFGTGKVQKRSLSLEIEKERFSNQISPNLTGTVLERPEEVKEEIQKLPTEIHQKAYEELNSEEIAALVQLKNFGWSDEQVIESAQKIQVRRK